MTMNNPVLGLLDDIYHLIFGGCRRIPADYAAMRVAARYGMTHEYKTARRHNLRPIEALEDWDLPVTDEVIEAYRRS